MFKLRAPSPALVVAVIALFVALGGTAVAASPIVKRALFADNAGKLNGKSPTQIAQQAARLPGPASTAAGLITIKRTTESLNAQQGRDFFISCDGGRKVVSAGFDSSGSVLAWDSRPTGDSTWGMYLMNVDESGTASVNVHAVCLG